MMIYSNIQKRGLTKVKELMYYCDRILCLFIKKTKMKIKIKQQVRVVVFNMMPRFKSWTLSNRHIYTFTK